MAPPNPPAKEHVAGLVSVAGLLPPGQPVGMGPHVPTPGTGHTAPLESIAWTAFGRAGFGGGGRFRRGSPETSTPVGAVVPFFTAPPHVSMWTTTSQSRPLSTPLSPWRRSSVYQYH